jgi:hypothetical protein
MHGHGLIGHLGRSAAGILVVLVAVLYVVIHPVNAVTLAYKVVMLLVQFADNFATGRYQ